MKQQGFTLIEMMIVTVLIGVIASIAIPAYQDYTIRARVTEGLAFARVLANNIKISFDSQGPRSFVCGTELQLDCINLNQSEAPVTKSILSVQSNMSGLIIIKYNSAVAPADKNSLQYIPVNPSYVNTALPPAVNLSLATSAGFSIVYVCRVNAVSPLMEKLVPSACKI